MTRSRSNTRARSRSIRPRSQGQRQNDAAFCAALGLTQPNIRPKDNKVFQNVKIQLRTMFLDYFDWHSTLANQPKEALAKVDSQIRAEFPAKLLTTEALDAMWRYIKMTYANQHWGFKRDRGKPRRGKSTVAPGNESRAHTRQRLTVAPIYESRGDDDKDADEEIDDEEDAMEPGPSNQSSGGAATIVRSQPNALRDGPQRVHNTPSPNLELDLLKDFLLAQRQMHRRMEGEIGRILEAVQLQRGKQ